MLLRAAAPILLLSSFLYLCNGIPLTDDEWLAEVDDVPLQPKAAETKSAEPKSINEQTKYAHDQFRMEHKAIGDAPVKTAFKSLAAGAVDSVVSGVVTLAGGVVEDLGDLVVSTVNQLPSTIKTVSDMVGSAVDFKREKANEVAKSIGLTDSVSGEPYVARNKAFQVMDNPRIRDHFGKLEEAFGSLIGKIIAVSYLNAGGINTALTDGFSRIAGDNSSRPPLLPAFRTRIVKVLDGRDQHPFSFQKTKIAKFIEAETKEIPKTNTDEELTTTA